MAGDEFEELGKESKFAHLLKPIRDLAENWNVDLAQVRKAEARMCLHEAPHWVSQEPAEEACWLRRRNAANRHGNCLYSGGASIVRPSDSCTHSSCPTSIAIAITTTSTASSSTPHRHRYCVHHHCYCLHRHRALHPIRTWRSTWSTWTARRLRSTRTGRCSTLPRRRC